MKASILILQADEVGSVDLKALKTFFGLPKI